MFVKPGPFVNGSFSLRLTCRGPRLEEYDAIDYAYNVNVVPNLEDDEALRKNQVWSKYPSNGPQRQGSSLLRDQQREGAIFRRLVHFSPTFLMAS